MEIQGNKQYLAVGTLVNNRYAVERLIGQGGMGAVYEAIDQRLKGTVALKQTLVEGEQSEKAFEREAQLLARLRHPALPKVIDYFSDADGQFLVMEFFPGNDLARLLEQRGEPFPVGQVLTWADQLLRALHYLHQQQPPVIHRDIKPQNLKLTTEGDMVLLDFGLARSHARLQSRTTSSGSILGYTPMYAPLEQIQGTGTDPRSDLYSLAATLHHLLTGSPPVDTLTRAAALISRRSDPQLPPHEINPQVPVAISDLLIRTMSLAPEERADSAEALRLALETAARGAGDLPLQMMGGALPLPPQSWNQETQAAPARSQPPERPVTPPPLDYEPDRQMTAQPTLPLQQAARPFPFSRRPAWAKGHTGEQQHVPSLFWPVLLIGLGVLWLLHNLGEVQINFNVIWRLWPLFLIMLGLNLIVGKRSPHLKAWIGAAGAVALLALIVVASLLGLGNTPAPQLKTDHVNEPIGVATSADVRLKLSSGSISVEALSDSANLIEGEMTYAGELVFDVQGKEEKVIELGVRGDSTGFFDWLQGPGGQEWDIKLSPQRPLALHVAGGAGETTLDLEELHLTDLVVEGGIGSWDITLPASPARYTATLRGGAGEFVLAIPEAAAVDLEFKAGAGSLEMTIGQDAAVDARISSGAGDFSIDVPDDAAVRVETTVGTGDVEVPEHFERIRTSDNGGVWETPGFEQARRQISIDVEGGLSSLEIH